MYLRVWLGWCARRTQGLYWFGRNIPTSSLLLLVLPALGLQYGLQTGERGRGSQVSGGRSERVLRARLPLSRVLVSFSCVPTSCFFAPLHEAPCFPFYRRRESVGYRGGKGEERERRRLPGLSGPSSPSCGSRRFCRCQQGRLHVVALFVTGTMRRRHLPVMAFHSVPANVMVN